MKLRTRGVCCGGLHNIFYISASDDGRDGCRHESERGVRKRAFTLKRDAERGRVMSQWDGMSKTQKNAECPRGGEREIASCWGAVGQKRESQIF